MLFLLTNFWQTMRIIKMITTIIIFIVVIHSNFGTFADDVPKKSGQRLKVLVYSPTYTWSHMQFMGTIADTLTEAGHDVHFMRLIPNNFTIDWPKEVHKVRTIHDIHQMFTDHSINIQQFSLLNDPFDGKKFTTFIWQSDIWEKFMGFSSNICKELTGNDQLISQFEAEKFDVAIAELYDICPFAMFHRIGAKTKLAALAAPLAQMTAQRFGIPTFASYVQDMCLPADGVWPMTFWARLINFYNALYNWVYIYQLPIKFEEKIVSDAFGSEFPKLDEIARNISLIFVNSNQFLEFPRPISNKVINIGGIVEMKGKQLDPAISRLMDNAKSGVVFISFGSFTNTKMMPIQMKMAFLNAFAQFADIEFIWKIDLLTVEETQLFAKHQNIHTVKWADQKAILLHPKTRAFITHCGLNSLTESARAGVPVLAIPLFGDQLYNAILAQQKGIGIKLDVNELKGSGANELFFNSLEKILNSASFRRNAKLLKRKIELTPFGPADKFVRWVEFAAQFSELNELNLPWDEQLGLFAFYSIDVILFSVVVLSFAAWALFKLAQTFVAQCFVPFLNKRQLKAKGQ